MSMEEEEVVEDKCEDIRGGITTQWLENCVIIVEKLMNFFQTNFPLRVEMPASDIQRQHQHLTSNVNIYKRLMPRNV